MSLINNIFKTLGGVALFLSLVPATQAAGEIPSCYSANQLDNLAQPPQREVFIMIDQTTPLDDGLKQSVLQNVGQLLRPGTAFAIASFSSFGQGQYLQLLAAGAIEQPLTSDQRSSIGVRVLKNLDQCLIDQHGYARNMAAAALKKALEGISSEYAKSDIMGSIRDMAVRVRASQAEDKILFLASDMLENSGTGSFYSQRNVRKLNVDEEIRKAGQAKLLADLGGARVFVLGAGLIQDPKSKKQPKDSGIYRSPAIMQALKDFWKTYFERSNASLEQFGMPALLHSIN